MNKYKKLFKNIFAMLVGNFASKILIFLMLPLYTEILTTEEYGIADLIFTTTNLLFPIFTCLATEYVMRFTLERNQDKSRVFSSALIINLIGFCLLICTYPIIKKIINIGELWILFYLYYFTTTQCNIVSQFVKGLEKIKVYSIGGVLNTFLVVISNIILLIYFKCGIIGYISAYIIGAIITIIYFWVKADLKLYIRLINISDIQEIKEYLVYSIPMIPNSISWWINNSLDKYILTFFCGVSATGIYAAGYKIPSFLTIVSSIFLSAWQISAVKDFGSKETNDFFSNIYVKYSSLVSILCGVVITLSQVIARILLSDDFYVAWQFAPILVYAYVFQTMSGFLGTIYTSSKQTKMLFISTAIGAGINVGLNICLIPKYESLGASIATAFSYLVVWLIRLVHSYIKIIQLKLRIKRDIVSYFILFILIIVTIMNNQYRMLASIALLGILFILNIDFFQTIIEMGQNIRKR